MNINDKSSSNIYVAHEKRYQNTDYKKCGKSGIYLPPISLGLWHNFGSHDNFENSKQILRTAFDKGITHFDLANNYGSPYGSAEENFGRVLNTDFKPYRDELLIATKAGYDMWPGPYGNWGSKKYLTASLDQSLKRMNLDYVDIFYHHRPDPETPLEETLHALSLLVKQGKALYIGLSRYSAEATIRAKKILKASNTPFIIQQSKYSLLERSIEDSVLPTLEQQEIGSIVFSPLAQGMLTDKYLNQIPDDSRAKSNLGHLQIDNVINNLNKVKALNELAKQRGEKLNQMALAWILQNKKITSVLMGASSSNQLLENLTAINSPNFTQDELSQIDKICNE